MFFYLLLFQKVFKYVVFDFHKSLCLFFPCLFYKQTQFCVSTSVLNMDLKSLIFISYVISNMPE